MTLNLNGFGSFDFVLCVRHFRFY